MRNIDDYTKEYEVDRFEQRMVKIRQDFLVKEINRYKHDNVLEIGCGLEPLFVCENISFDNWLIVEPSELFTKEAGTLAKAHGIAERVTIIKGFLENEIETVRTALKDKQSLDFIVLSSLLHELENPRKMLEEVHKLCAKDTIVHINVPNAKSLHRLIALECGMIDDEHSISQQSIKFQQHRTYDMDILKKTVEEAGFAVIDQGSYFVKPFTHAQLQRCLDEKIIDESVIRGLEGVSKYFPEYGAEIYVNVKLKD